MRRQVCSSCSLIKHNPVTKLQRTARKYCNIWQQSSANKQVPIHVLRQSAGLDKRACRRTVLGARHARTATREHAKANLGEPYGFKHIQTRPPRGGTCVSSIPAQTCSHAIPYIPPGPPERMLRSMFSIMTFRAFECYVMLRAWRSSRSRVKEEATCRSLALWRRQGFFCHIDNTCWKTCNGMSRWKRNLSMQDGTLAEAPLPSSKNLATSSA